jgi:hypothetical protein
MRTFAEKPKGPLQTSFVKPTIPVQSHFGQRHETNSKMNSASVLSTGFAFNFSRVPVSGRTTLLGEEDKIGPVSRSQDAGVSVPDAVPTAPAPTPPTTAPVAVCTIATKTLIAAADGSANTRKEVGVNEQVELTSSVSARWTASSGTLTPPVSGITVIWTAPDVGATSTVTATPATGAPCSVSINVLPPSHRSLANPPIDRVYSAGLAGSGFKAVVTIKPTNVSFRRIQVWEEAVNAVASGYYDTVLHWNGLPHPPTKRVTPDAANNGLLDTIGTEEPGTPGPFSTGKFVWAIPQHYRIIGNTGNGVHYSTGYHVQLMTKTDGTEGTTKEGASRGRVP